MQKRLSQKKSDDRKCRKAIFSGLLQVKLSNDITRLCVIRGIRRLESFGLSAQIEELPIVEG
jgi:hypothetical protein